MYNIYIHIYIYIYIYICIYIYIYIQEKDNELLMNLDWYNNIIMQYQKIINLLDNTSKQPPQFGTKNWVEINDKLRGA